MLFHAIGPCAAEGAQVTSVYNPIFRLFKSSISPAGIPHLQGETCPADIGFHFGSEVPQQQSTKSKGLETFFTDP